MRVDDHRAATNTARPAAPTGASPSAREPGHRHRCYPLERYAQLRGRFLIGEEDVRMDLGELVRGLGSPGPDPGRISQLHGDDGALTPGGFHRGAELGLPSRLQQQARAEVDEDGTGPAPAPGGGGEGGLPAQATNPLAEPGLVPQGGEHRLENNLTRIPV